MRTTAFLTLLPLALAAPSNLENLKRQDSNEGAVCGAPDSAPCSYGLTCLTPDQYVCLPGNGCTGRCQKQHAPDVCGIGKAGYDCPDGQTCLTSDGHYCGEGQTCFGYCTVIS